MLSRRRKPLILPILAVLATTSTMAEEPDRPARTLDTAALMARFAEDDPMPLVKEIQAVMDSSRTVAEALRADNDLTAEQRHLALSELQRETRLQVLWIQARHARRAGSFRLEQRILASIDALRHSEEPSRPESDPELSVNH